MEGEPASLGLEVRIGAAVVVILRGGHRAPRIALRHDLSLADPWVPESMHPYHRELGGTGAEGEAARQRGSDAARAAAARAVSTLVADMRAHALEPSAAAMVTSSRDTRVRSDRAHARAHAEEAKLYLEAVQAALAACDLPAAMFLDRTLRAVAIERLRVPPSQLDATLKAFSHEVGTPWRGSEKHAALAAWLVLPD